MTAGTRATAATWRALPLLLLAAMLVIAMGVELAVHRVLLWQPKLPLVLLLLLPWLRSAGGRRRTGP